MQSPATASTLDSALSVFIERRSRHISLACRSSWVSVCSRIWNCVDPHEKLSTVVTVAKGNATRRAVSVASVMVVPASGLGSILTSVDSCDLVTAEMVAPASTRRATARSVLECTWAGLVATTFSANAAAISSLLRSLDGDEERRSRASDAGSAVWDIRDLICLKWQVSITKGALAAAGARVRMVEEDDDRRPMSGGRRRGRGSVPAAPSRGDRAPSVPGEADALECADGVSAAEQAGVVEDLQQLKAIWSRVLDRVYEVLTSPTSRAQPRGRQSQEEIMQLWGKVTWPLVFLSRLRTQSVGDAASVALQDTEASMLKRSIEHAIEAESALEEELRISIGLSDSYRLLESSLHTSKKHSSPVPFDNACALLAAAVREMQEATGIYLDGDNLLNSLATLSVLAHFNVTREATEPDCACMPTTPDAQPTADGCPTHAACVPTRFEHSNEPGDLVVLSLRPCAFASDFMHHICNESSTSLNATIVESVVPISRGIMFSDRGLGITCLATSVLPDLGIELDEGGSKALLSSKGTERFFEYAFADETASPAVGGWADGAGCPWDASPDIETDLEW